MYWRSQRWRSGEKGGQQRWANRGGRNREWWSAWRRALKMGKDHAAQWLRENPKPARGGEGGGDASGSAT